MTARTKREQCVEINSGLNKPSYCLKTCSSTAGQPGFCFYYRKWLQCLSCSTVHYTHLHCVVGEMMVVLLQLALDPDMKSKYLVGSGGDGGGGGGCLCPEAAPMMVFSMFRKGPISPVLLASAMD